MERIILVAGIKLASMQIFCTNRVRYIDKTRGTLKLRHEVTYIEPQSLFHLHTTFIQRNKAEREYNQRKRPKKKIPAMGGNSLQNEPTNFLIPDAASAILQQDGWLTYVHRL